MLWKTAWAFVVLAAMPMSAGAAGCGEAFEGTWILDASGYGQENRTTFRNEFSWAGVLSLTSETGTRRWGDGHVVTDIQHLVWDQKHGNISIKSLDRKRCQATLRRPIVKSQNTGGRYDASTSTNVGILTISGSRLKWCWVGKGNKVMGNCNIYRKSR